MIGWEFIIEVSPFKFQYRLLKMKHICFLAISCGCKFALTCMQLISLYILNPLLHSIGEPLEMSVKEVGSFNLLEVKSIHGYEVAKVFMMNHQNGLTAMGSFISSKLIDALMFFRFFICQYTGAGCTQHLDACVFISQIDMNTSGRSVFNLRRETLFFKIF